MTKLGTTGPPRFLASTSGQGKNRERWEARSRYLLCIEPEPNDARLITVSRIAGRHPSFDSRVPINESGIALAFELLTVCIVFFFFFVQIYKSRSRSAIRARLFAINEITIDLG